jgi:hypothetical protein
MITEKVELKMVYHDDQNNFGYRRERRYLNTQFLALRETCNTIRLVERSKNRRFRRFI